MTGEDFLQKINVKKVRIYVGSHIPLILFDMSTFIYLWAIFILKKSSFPYQKNLICEFILFLLKAEFIHLQLVNKVVPCYQRLDRLCVLI